MYSEILILALLKQRPRHGYEIKKDVENVLGGTAALNNKTLYPALKHFEETGAVVREVITQVGRPDRHLYQITERGIELLQAYLRDFPAELAASESEFFTRVAFFDYLEPQQQEEILKTRQAYIQACLEHLHKLQQWATSEDEANSNPQRILAFHLQRARNEYQWIAAWLEEIQAQTQTE